jgi:hypothetical protein
MQRQGITNVIESDTMGELREEQSDYVTPRSKGPGLFVHLGFARDPGDQKLRNEVANLAQQIQF